jgi:hypothetical protein
LGMVPTVNWFALMLISLGTRDNPRHCPRERQGLVLSERGTGYI